MTEELEPPRMRRIGQDLCRFAARRSAGGMMRTLALLVLLLLVATRAWAQTAAPAPAPDTTQVLTDREVRQRLDYEIANDYNAATAAIHALEHAQLLRAAVHARITRDSLRALAARRAE